MDKSPDAFRTISEVAEHLETPAHVLRFWETRFPQIRPVKRAGGRRYYRPSDVALISGIKRLLHDEGLTIRGVQKILREQGVRHVAALAGDIGPDDSDLDAEAALEAALNANFGLLDDEAVPSEQAESATVVALETALRRVEPVHMAKKAPPAADETPSLFDLAYPTEPAEVKEAKLESVFKPPYTVSLPDSVEFAPDSDDDDAPTVDPAQADLPAADLQSANLPLPDRLRALPQAAVQANAAAFTALHQRLVALQARLTATP